MKVKGEASWKGKLLGRGVTCEQICSRKTNLREWLGQEESGSGMVGWAFPQSFRYEKMGL